MMCYILAKNNLGKKRTLTFDLAKISIEQMLNCVSKYEVLEINYKKKREIKKEFNEYGV